MNAFLQRVKRVSFRGGLRETNNMALDIMIVSQTKSEIAPPVT